uniref:ATP-dependent DNA helicase n=1 Tax=Octopus bimaculoides TaxID=37653 RepID=A0A0L8GIW6_OCTBM
MRERMKETVSGDGARFAFLNVSERTPSDANILFTLNRLQFPLRLAYSMTINKAQGQTFEKVGIHLPQPIFSHGQLYITFSRAQAMNNIKELWHSIGITDKAKNVV